MHPNKTRLTPVRPYANTKGQWLARNILLGFFTAPVEALPQISVTDVVSKAFKEGDPNHAHTAAVLYPRARNIHGSIRILLSGK